MSVSLFVCEFVNFAVIEMLTHLKMTVKIPQSQKDQQCVPITFFPWENPSCVLSQFSSLLKESCWYGMLLASGLCWKIEKNKYQLETFHCETFTIQNWLERSSQSITQIIQRFYTSRVLSF